MGKSFLLLAVTIVLVKGDTSRDQENQDISGGKSRRQLEEEDNDVSGGNSRRLLEEEDDDVSTRLIVRYRNSRFIISDGCPSQDDKLIQFYKYCLQTSTLKTLCMKTSGFPLELPLFSNMCSALCHGYQQQDFTLCPRQAKVIQQVQQIKQRENLGHAVP